MPCSPIIRTQGDVSDLYASDRLHEHADGNLVDICHALAGLRESFDIWHMYNMHQMSGVHHAI